MPAAPRESGGWVLVERGLQGTGGVLKGAGDIVSLGVGGTFRLAGSFVRFLGSGIETVGNAVAGDAAAVGDGRGELRDGDAGGATRRLLSRPMKVVSGAVKSAGDGFTMLGDTTERIAGEALGIMPDAVDVVQSGVGALRKRVRFDVNEDSSGSDWRYLAALSAEAGGRATPPLHEGPHASSPAAAAGDASGAEAARWAAAAAAGREPAAAAGGGAMPEGGGSVERLVGPRSTPHAALALLCLAACARLAAAGAAPFHSSSLLSPLPTPPPSALLIALLLPPLSSSTPPPPLSSSHSSSLLSPLAVSAASESVPHTLTTPAPPPRRPAAPPPRRPAAPPRDAAAWRVGPGSRRRFA